MSRKLMPESGALAPYVVVNKDAAVAGVFSIDGEAGIVDLTTKYLQISNYNADVSVLNIRLDGIDSSISSLNSAVGSNTEAIGNINTSLANKAEKGANNDITELNALTKAITIAQGGTGATTAANARTNLALNRFTQSTTETSILSADGLKRLVISDNGWGAYNDDTTGGPGWLALGIGQGGTGVRTQAEIWPAIRPAGPTTLVGDAVGDYDAVTLRQARNMSGGTGPTLNGVMNYGVGQPSLWLTRAFIPSYALPQDGQLVNRADWPELWAHAQQHGAIADSLWVGDPLKRGVYSTGDGTTTFRLPDLNGVQKNGVNGFTGPDSLSALYARGDAGIAAGQLIAHGAPNVTGYVDIRSGRTSGGTLASSILTTNGALTNGGTPTSANNAPNSLNDIAATNASRISFSLAAGNSVYNAGEVRPNSFYNVWIVRASGGFTAANTSWSVINGDATLPGTGTEVYGGGIRSDYNVGGVVRNRIEIKVKERVGGSVTPVISITAKGAAPVTKTLATIEDLAEATKWRLANDPLVVEYLGFNVNDTALTTDRMFKFAADMSSVEVRGMFIIQTGIANRNLIDILKLPTGFTSWSTVYSQVLPSTGEAFAYMPTQINQPARALVRTSSINAAATWVMVNFTIVFNK